MRAFFITTLLLLLQLNAFPQAGNPEKDITRTVDNLFTAMHTGDSALLRSCFMPEATLRSVYESGQGITKIQDETIDDFVKAVGTPHKEKWLEKIENVEIRIDGPLAIVWAPYHFYVDEKLSHRGVNAFEMVYFAGNWLILSITDTRRK